MKTGNPVIVQEPVQPSGLVARVVLPVVLNPLGLYHVDFVVQVVAHATQEHAPQEEEEKRLKVPPRGVLVNKGVLVGCEPELICVDSGPPRES